MLFTICALYSIGGLILASQTDRDEWLGLGVLATLAVLVRGLQTENWDVILSAVLWLAFWLGLGLMSYIQKRRSNRAEAGQYVPSIYNRAGDRPILFLGVTKARQNGVDYYEGRILGTTLSRRDSSLAAIQEWLTTEADAFAAGMVERHQAAKAAGDPGATTHLIPDYTLEDIFRIRAVSANLTVRTGAHCVLAEFLEL